MIFDEYLAAISTALKEGNATEHTHRPALKTLIESLASGITATNEPQRIECGSPDFIVARRSVPIGYIEAKDVGTDLDRAQDSKQLRRYRESLGNLILTDYLEFRLFRAGELISTVSLGRRRKDGAIAKASADGLQEAQSVLDSFLSANAPVINNPRELAERMARIARLICDLIKQVFAQEGSRGDLHAQYDAFKKVLISELSPTDFADMYAQTIAYGLFAARCNHLRGRFTRQDAGADLPKTNPFLRKLFNTIAGADLDDRISWAVDDLAELLATADMTAILEHFGRATRQEDPIVHFYETFLAAYDPAMREARGVYYAPEPVVGFIVRSVDLLLRDHFRLREGLADTTEIRIRVPNPTGRPKTREVVTHRVQILDPACGTGTFLYAAISHIRRGFGNNRGLWTTYVPRHLLPRLYGFELLMAPYAVAHMKLGLELRDSGYDFATDERLRVFLTNSLEEAHEQAGLPLFAQWLADEAAAASEVKRDVPIMVILGNPPYSGHSINKGAWIESLMEEYKRSPELRKPAQAKWLSDDYVKFIRFAQWRIQQTGYGVLGFVTNHSYLDNPTFLDMRTSLMATFDDIYILDLHGNSKKHEVAPDGSEDKNVFDIQQGVAICLMIKRSERSGTTTIRHADLWGSRAAKYAWLDEHDVTNTPWTQLGPSFPKYRFVPQDEALASEYEAGWSIVDAMNLNGEPVPGFATQHDEFAISFSTDEALHKVQLLLDSANEAEAREHFTLCGQNQWRYDRAKQQLSIPQARRDAIKVTYRPFDTRVTIYDRNVLTHRRERISPLLLRDNLALAIPKNAEAIGDTESSFFFCVDKPADLNLFRRGGAYLVPLWIYPDKPGEGLFASAAGQPVPNFAPEFLAHVRGRTQLAAFEPLQLFSYIYALLYTPGYQQRYSEFLKRTFPRIPVTSNPQQFLRLAELGSRLIDLHLMRTNASALPSFPVAGNNRVEAVEYKSNRVQINPTQYFDGVSQSAWDFHIGGYRVAERWLKDRKGRALTFDDLDWYRRIVGALDATVALRDELDAAIPSWPLT